MKKQSKKNGRGTAGWREAGARSDCYLELTITKGKGIKIDLTSKVEALYGDSIRSLIGDVVQSLGIDHAEIIIDDCGAVPFVIAARVEGAAKRALPELEASYLLPARARQKDSTRNRLRRTRLYLPGNQPHIFLNAGLHKPDCIILDLEDSVAPSEKDTARILVRNALRQVNFGDAERMVRINPLPEGIKDMEHIVAANVQTILIPKCESAASVTDVENEIKNLLSLHKTQRKIFLLPIIESALGVVRAFEIATASPWICGLAIGLEDYTADLGVQRTTQGLESLYARNVVINAAKAAGIQALDSVFSDFGDDDGLRKSTLEAKAMGFDGKGCIHPRQIRIIHQALAPTAEEIDYAQRVVNAFEEAKRNGSGVIALGSKMIDAPVVKRAHHLLLLAKMNSSSGAK